MKHRSHILDIAAEKCLTTFGFLVSVRCLFFIILLIVGSEDSMSKNYYWNSGRGYKPFSYASKEGICIDNHTDSLLYDYIRLEKSSGNFNLRFRAKNLSGKPSKSYYYFTSDRHKNYEKNPHWGLIITTVKDTLTFTFKTHEKFNPIESGPTLLVRGHNLTKSVNRENYLSEKINPFDGENLFDVSISDGKINLTAGNNHLYPVMDLPFVGKITGFGFFAGWGDTVMISDISLETDNDYMEFSPNLTIYELDEKLKESNDPMEGYWVIFDRELEESLLKLGGTYSLACVKEGDDYFLLYLDGASVNSANWNQLDIKAILHTSPFPGIYEVEWFDSLKDPMTHDIKAQYGDGETLLIQFPYQNSKLRLRKVPR